MSYEKVISVLIVFLCMAVNSWATINFDDIDTSAQGSSSSLVNIPVPDDYQGFSWAKLNGSSWDDQFFVLDNQFYNDEYLEGLAVEGSETDLDFPSNENAVYNGGGAYSVAFTSTELFSFSGASFASWVSTDSPTGGQLDTPKYQGYSARSVTVIGLNGSSTVGSQTLSLNSNGTFSDLSLASAWEVDTLQFFSSGEDEESYWLMDDLLIDTDGGGDDPGPGPVGPVPEPSTMCLLGLGILAFAGTSRKKI